jgi:hypothetical protein
MSNTTSLSSYAGSAYTDSGAAIGQSVGRSAAALVGWLCTESAEDRAVIERRNKERREERLASTRLSSASLATSAPPLSITTVPLKLTAAEPLVRSAETLGYHLEPLANSLAPLAQQSTFLLRNAAGERLAITRNRHGRLDVHTTSNQQPVDRLMRQHNTDQAFANLASQGMQLEMATLANGETQILGREQGAEQPGGKAVVRAQVRENGNVDVDVDCVLGKRCEKIVGDLAHAIGAEAMAVTKKSAYYEEPGEPTRTQVKV